MVAICQPGGAGCIPCADHLRADITLHRALRVDAGLLVRPGEPDEVERGVAVRHQHVESRGRSRW